MKKFRWAVCPEDGSTSTFRKGRIFKMYSFSGTSFTCTYKSNGKDNFLFCLVHGCAHLRGGTWKLFETRREARQFAREIKEGFEEIEI